LIKREISIMPYRATANETASIKHKRTVVQSKKLPNSSKLDARKKKLTM